MKRLQYLLALLPFVLLHLAESTSAQNVGIGTTTPSYKLHTIGDIYANGGWFRVSGNQGLYWESWGGGFYMSDATWIRTYNNRNIWTGAGLLGTDGGLTSGYGGTTPPGGGAIIAGLTGMGTTAPNQRLTVVGNIELAENFDNVLVSRNTTQNRQLQVIGTYMGWDQQAIYLGGYNVNNPSASYGNANKVYCGGPTGSIPIYATSFVTSSSRRLKTDFQSIPYGLNEVLQLQPQTYRYTFEQNGMAQRHMGLIAEDVLNITPEAVSVENGKALGIDYGSLVPVLIRAIQEQQAMIKAQDERIRTLESAQQSNK